MTIRTDARGARVYDAEAYSRYPVQPGELWEVGPHVMACLDVEDGSVVSGLMHIYPPDAVWTDPPWGSGNARSFRTKAAADGPQGRPVNWRGLLARLAGLWAACGGDVWVEMGRREEADTVEACAAAGLGLVSSTPITYYRRSPCRLLRFRRGASGAVSEESWAAGRDDWDIPGDCLWQSIADGHLPPDGTVWDPCLGQGLIPVRVAELNRDHGVDLRFAGTELNHQRMAVALHRLAGVVGASASRVS